MQKPGVKRLTEYDFPADLKQMSLSDMELLSYEIRDFLIESISETGGHLASNLGVVELTMAIHRVFNSPKDRILWDVGHQTYVHKILTGRASRFCTLRQEEGLSGFPKREESVHDTFDAGHSSNSISAAMGFAEARDLSGGDHDVVAVIGDGALTGGPAFEGLNNAGNRRTRLIVILNDNEMSISENIGGISQHLSRLRTSKTYLDFKRQLKKTLRGIPGVGEGLYQGAEHIRDWLKYAVAQSGAIFEDLGFKYFGPVDGHNLHDLIEVLSVSRLIDQPVLIHVLTKKGKGYRNAELDPGRFHGVGPFLPNTGRPKNPEKGISWSDVFGNALVRLADADPSIIAVTAAMKDATGLAPFSRRFPGRLFDAGIAEAHAVSFAAGMALSGYRPFVAVYSTFLQRAYDQILMDVCMQNLPVVFAIDRAGNVGPDGETHHGLFDLSWLRHMPNLTLMAPADRRELESVLELAAKTTGPLAIRYPKGASITLPGPAVPVVRGKSHRLLEGQRLDIWAVGRMVEVGLEVCELLKKKGIQAGLVNACWIRPLDEQALLNAASRNECILTLEDNTIHGGFGESVCAFLQEAGVRDLRVLCHGWPDRFIEQGAVSALMKKYELDAESIAEGACRFLEGTSGYRLAQ